MSEKRLADENAEAAAQEERLAEAALWLERLSCGEDDRTQAAFESWLAASDLNLTALENVRETQEIAAQAADRPEILALRQQTLARVALGRNRVGWRGLPVLRSCAWRRHGGDAEGGRNARGRAAIGVALAVCLVSGFGIWLTAGQGFPSRESAGLSQAARAPETTYRTGVGEQATIELADGSQIVLNTASAVRVAYSDTVRDLVLENGQAFFTVAKDTRRPFNVEAAGRVVTALGTAFDVRIQKEAVQVALLEGKVVVSSGANAGREVVRLKPNDMLIAGKNTLEIVKLGNPASFTAWRDGLLVFQNDTLQSAVEEMNRYSTTRIVLDSRDVARLRISGTFRIGQTTAFLEALREMFPVQVVKRSPDEIVLAEK